MEKLRELVEFYIGGKWIAAHSKARHTMVDPSSEQRIGMVALGDEYDVDLAVAAARRAFSTWSQSPLIERVALIRRLSDIYAKRQEEMAQAISQEMGAPISLARERQAPAVLRHITNFLNAVDHFEFERYLGPHAPDDRILMQPIGPVGLVTPWNWPMSQVALKVIPALLAGCTVVLKPSEFAPLSATLLAEMLDAAAAPAGTFNLVQGDGASTGARLVSHPDIAMISFTGSSQAGRSVSKGAADTFKRVALELGGKGANLIFSDADTDAVERGVKQCFLNSGQSCNAPTRMLVERSIYDQVVEAARSVAGKVSVGPSGNEGDHIGPVVSSRQYERIQSLIESGIEQGARLVTGGPGRPAGFNRGYFVRPTVFADVEGTMTIAREEIFGPVLSIMPFDDEEQAVQIANDTLYGLTNYVQSADVARRRRLAGRLHSGTVEMNGRPRGAGSPFGGVGYSGGAREGGVWGLEEYMIVKSVSGWT